MITKKLGNLLFLINVLILSKIRKIGNLKVTDILAVQGRVLEVASPPQQQVRLTNTEINPFATQDQAKSLEIWSNVCDVRKDMIGSRQDIRQDQD